MLAGFPPHTFIETPNLVRGYYPSTIPAGVGLPGDGNTVDNSSYVKDRGNIRQSYKACPETVNALEASINSNATGWYSVVTFLGKIALDGPVQGWKTRGLNHHYHLGQSV